MFRIGNKDNYRGKVSALDHHFFVSGPIEEEEDYIDLIHTLYTAQPSETVVLYLNTPGGRLDLTMQIINAMRSSEADVIAIADGAVASAGSLILFAAPNIGVQPLSYVMMHDGTEGLGGKSNENLKQAQFTTKLMRQICRSIYGPFFSEEEIDSLLDGKDMWLTSEDVESRINKVVEIKKDKEENEEE